MSAGKAGKMPTLAEATVQAKPDGVINKVDEALRKIESAQKQLRALQSTYHSTHAYYAQCEKIDDDLHDALSILGQ